MMSGCGILTNGKGTRREYCEFSLDELQEGDHIGLTRKSNSALHFFINGIDQGKGKLREGCRARAFGGVVCTSSFCLSDISLPMSDVSSLTPPPFLCLPSL